jgi:hypothetical protein
MAGSGFNPAMMGGGNITQGLGQFLSGIFGDSGAPFDEFMKQYQQYANKGAEAQQPWWEAGKNAIPDYQKWLQGMQDPASFMNKMMGQYQESPYAHNLQQQAMRAGQNMGSATGMTGSTPLMQQMQQNAGNIASGDQQQWLQNALGVNRDYGAGQQSMMNMGQNSANSLTQLYQQMAEAMGKGAMGKEAGKQQDWNDMFSGGMKFLFGI